jgi:hypothetical protein
VSVGFRRNARTPAPRHGCVPAARSTSRVWSKRFSGPRLVGIWGGQMNRRGGRRASSLLCRVAGRDGLRSDRVWRRGRPVGRTRAACGAAPGGSDHVQGRDDPCGGRRVSHRRDALRRHLRVGGASRASVRDKLTSLNSDELRRLLNRPGSTSLPSPNKLRSHLRTEP